MKSTIRSCGTKFFPSCTFLYNWQVFCGFLVKTDRGTLIVSSNDDHIVCGGPSYVKLFAEMLFKSAECMALQTRFKLERNTSYMRMGAVTNLS